MSNASDWEKFWESKAEEKISDYEYDRGHDPRGQAVEALEHQEFFEFVAPDPNEIVFDAGCGSGVNLFRLHTRVKRMIGMDYVEGAIQRCRERFAAAGVGNVELMQGSITDIPLPDRSVNKVLCLSVMQYLDDEQFRRAIREFARVLPTGGVLIMHVKNLASIYLSTLRLAKRVKHLVTGSAKLEFIRTFGWYERELRAAGFELEDYNSANVFTVDRMPRRLVMFLQAMELRRRKSAFFRWGFIRRHGADLKLKARVKARN